ncbi:MAG TPA: hypothetical protein DCK76_11465 [Desulfotomaculum sp.]|nr:hypothetical protein [Desulfotomaculum sp.]HBY04745.1 hypothetical protein [Desulfotomaculum sp.]
MIFISLLTGFPALGWPGAAMQNVSPGTGDGTARPLTSSPSKQNKVVMVIVDRMVLEDLIDPSLTGFHKIIQNGAISLMNCNTAGNNLLSENTYATIGAGSHIIATGTSAMGLNAKEEQDNGPAGLEYYRRTGRKVPPSAVVQLDITRFGQLNSELPYPAVPGALGDCLHEAGLKTAVLGNSDVTIGFRREVLSVAMDRYGMVDYGDVSASLLEKMDDRFPGGYSTNYARVLQEMDRLPGDTALTVIETGDLSRLEEFRNYVSDSVWAAERKRTMQRIDQFIGKALDRLDPDRDLLLIVTPTPGKGAGEENDYLSAILAVGAGVREGVLFSPTTKRQGILMNTDLAPTILGFLGLEKPEWMNGQILLYVKAENQLNKLVVMKKQLTLTYDARSIFQKGYCVYQIGLLLVSLYFILTHRKAARLLQPFLLSVMAVPLVYLLLAFLPQPSFPVLTLELFLLTAWITCLAWWFERRHNLGSFIFLSLATAGLLILDTAVGAPLQKTSIMSYDPIAGARFYGIGNEYMGVLMGSLIIGCTTLMSKFERYRKALLVMTGIIFLITVYVLVSPALGSKMGGAIVSVAALAVTFLLLCNVKFKLRTVIYLAVIIIGLVAVIPAIDLLRPAELQSHFGRNASLILSGGWQEIQNIIVRKTEMNLKLIRYTYWTRIFIASLVSLALLFYRPVGVMATIRKKRPDLYKGFVGVVTASIVALIFNDAGIVAAATTMIFGAPPIVYLVLQEQK